MLRSSIQSETNNAFSTSGDSPEVNGLERYDAASEAGTSETGSSKKTGLSSNAGQLGIIHDSDDSAGENALVEGNNWVAFQRVTRFFVHSERPQAGAAVIDHEGLLLAAELGINRARQGGGLVRFQPEPSLTDSESESQDDPRKKRRRMS